MTGVRSRAEALATSPRAAVLLLALALSVATIGVARIGSAPTGSDSASDTAAPGERLAASQPLDDVEVLIVASGGSLSVRVAYPGPKGWLSVRLPAAPSTAVAAWAATDGAGPIPAVSVVYGRTDAASVVVRWVDGTASTVRPGADGVYLAVREELVGSGRVELLDADGVLMLQVDGP